MIRGYFDESYRDKGIYAIGGYLAKDKTWTSISRQWKNRCLQDRVQCFHAADCESGFGEFKKLSVEQRRDLKTDLIQIVDKHDGIGGFGAALIIDEFAQARDSSERARKVLGPDPYFFCFQIVLLAVCEDFLRFDPSGTKKTACVFEDQEEFSGRTKRLFDEFKKMNPNYAPRLTTLTYAPKRQFIPLQVADNLAYETMKEIHNREYDPTRSRRISMAKMIPKIQSIKLVDRRVLQLMTETARVSSDLAAQ